MGQMMIVCYKERTKGIDERNADYYVSSVVFRLNVLPIRTHFPDLSK